MDDLLKKDSNIEIEIVVEVKVLAFAPWVIESRIKGKIVCL